jgi:ABC-type polysaccharide/polyol phosphate transport system ATPase subunit
MAKIDLHDLSLTFTIRQQRKVTLKEYLTRMLFLPSRNPKIAVHALSQINLQAKDGDRIGIIGHNGAGKSTLLKMLAGVYPPTSGTRVVEGRICSLFDIALGFEFEANGWENIKYRAFLMGETPKTLQAKIQSIADFSELGDFLNIPVRYYSSGMLVRLAFSISTAVNPEVLLIDEVLSAGDMAFQIKARQRMQEMMATARLMVLVTHEISTVEQICSRAIWMQHGGIVMDGKPKEVVAAYQKSMSAPAEAHHVGGITNSDDPAAAEAVAGEAKSLV